MDEYGKVPEDNRLWLVFKEVGRLACSYKKSAFGSATEKAEKLDPVEISSVIRSFNGQSIYGWDFINCGDEYFEKRKGNLSFDYSPEALFERTNTIDVFQYGMAGGLDLRIWFEDFEIRNLQGQPVALEAFLENGKRGWEAIYAGDKQMARFGIVPAKNSLNRLKDWWRKIIGKFNFLVNQANK